MGGLSARGRRTRASLLAAAREVFDRDGYGAARIEDVTDAADVSHGTFYTYFDNKADVLAALLDGVEQPRLAAAEATWEGDDAAEVVEDVISQFVEAFVETADVVLVWIEASAHVPAVRDRLTRTRRAYTAGVAERLGPVLTGTPHDPTVAATALTSMVEGVATRELSEGGDHEQAVATLARCWYGALTALR